MEALANLGIDGKLLLAQVVNFAILLWVLKRYAYKPMLDMMDARSAKIEKGLSDAENATKKLAEIEQKEKEVLGAAQAEGKQILAAVEESAKKRDAAKLAETEAQVKKLLADSEAKMTADQAKMLAEAKGELAETVLLAVEKILREKLDAGKEKEMIEKMLK
jgi:F-type H+-transporting ATPase subunit b